jgi:hypothetical protein
MTQDNNLLTDGETVERVWQDFWKGIITNPDGSIDVEQVKKELYDFRMVMLGAAKVYCHITHDRISKPNTDPDAVIRVADDLQTEACQEASDDEAEATKEELQRLGWMPPDEAAQVRQQTLKEVGEWMDKTVKIDDLSALHTRPNLLALVEGIKALKSGKPPTDSGKEGKWRESRESMDREFSCPEEAEEFAGWEADQAAQSDAEAQAAAEAEAQAKSEADEAEAEQEALNAK